MEFKKLTSVPASTRIECNFNIQNKLDTFMHMIDSATSNLNIE